jgi:hypothetical protein
VLDDLLDVLVDRARGAAFTADPLGRGWEAVRTAALLRQRGELEEALSLLDGVVAHFEHPELETAAYACAVAVHCDAGRPGTAIRVGRPVWEATGDEHVGRALVRAYWERAEETGDPLDRDAWAAFGRELGERQAAV